LADCPDFISSEKLMLKLTHSFLLLLFLVNNLFAVDASKPNILLIVADDLGWKDVGWHGGSFHTPVMDKLVKEGVELDGHYVQPVCSPTRTALLSGRFTSRFGPHVLSPTNLRAYPPGTVTLATALKQAGYATHMAGKWHLGSKLEWGPQNYGFDHSYGSLNGAVDPWNHKYRKGPYEDTWHRDGKRIDEEGNATELVSKEVLGWINAEKKSPWFIYVPFHAVHIPVDAPEEYKLKYKNAKLNDDPAKNESLQRFGSFVTQLDTKIGGFIEALEKTGQRKNTLIVFTSDNGGLHSGGNAYVSKVPPTPALSSNLPLRGQKNTLYEGGIRVCAFANWPGTLEPRKVSAPLHACDWMPTLTKLAGWNRPKDFKQDGIDAWPMITGKNQKPEPRNIYIPHPSGSVVNRAGWKLIEYKGKAKSELYHLEKDPYETSNLADKMPDKVKELQAILQELKKDDVTKLPEDLLKEKN